jgi:hypothetical protein
MHARSTGVSRTNKGICDRIRSRVRRIVPCSEMGDLKGKVGPSLTRRDRISSDYFPTIGNLWGNEFAYLQRICQGSFADFTLDELSNFEYPVMNYRRRSIYQIFCAGFSADSVTRKAKHVLNGAAGLKVPIPRCVGIDAPAAIDHNRSTDPATKTAVAAALLANPHGMVLSHKYSKMRLTNLTCKSLCDHPSADRSRRSRLWKDVGSRTRDIEPRLAGAVKAPLFTQTRKAEATDLMSESR